MDLDCSCSVSAINSSSFSSLFLAVSIHLSFAGLGGVKLNWDILHHINVGVLPVLTT